MRWGDTIDLIDTIVTGNDAGDTISTPTARTVFANKKSIRQSEFYQAQATGLEPEIMFDVRSIEYQGEKSLTYAGKSYNVIRTFTKNGEITELICSGLVNEVS